MTRIDTHIHVVGDASGLLPNRTYTPPPAPLSALQAQATAHGVERFVIVQPSFYGTDNRVLLDTLATLGPHGRGVAVIDPAAPGDLAAMHQAGVRGLRINLYSTLGHAQPLDASFTPTAAIAARLGWHVELLAALPLLAARATLLVSSPAPLVIDHYGLYAGYTPATTEGIALLALLSQPHVSIKLSAPYRVEPDPVAVRPDPAWMAALLQAGGGRCVWGSDWPHTPPHAGQTGGGIALPYRPLDYGDAINGFIAAAGPHAEAILTTNAARLYGFAP